MKSEFGAQSVSMSNLSTSAFPIDVKADVVVVHENEFCVRIAIGFGSWRELCPVLLSGNLVTLT